MSFVVRIVASVLALSLGLAGAVSAQSTQTKQDRRGPVTVAVTPTSPPAAGTPLKVKVVLDTHSVGLDAIAFDKAVAVRAADGTEVAPTAVETKGGGHHLEAVLTFPPLADGSLRIVVKDVGGVPERLFVWE